MSSGYERLVCWWQDALADGLKPFIMKIKLLSHFELLFFLLVGLNAPTFCVLLSNWMNHSSNLTFPPFIFSQSGPSLRRCFCWISCSSGGPGGRRSASTSDTAHPGHQVRTHSHRFNSVSSGVGFKTNEHTNPGRGVEVRSVTQTVMILIICLQLHNKTEWEELWGYKDKVSYDILF